ncbi:MAG: cation-translocating P-type ATPase [Pseudomonadota bacterium]|nr:cation-translocating P-type ATPase [Pseudomonadota bacterium]
MSALRSGAASTSAAACADTSCACAATLPLSNGAASKAMADFSGRLLAVFGVVIVAVVAIVITAEWMGLLDKLSTLVPTPVWLALVALGGYPIFRSVLRAAWRRKVTSHTLMTVGLVAAMLSGAWPAAVLIVFFMRLADTIERFTAERARSAVRDLTLMAPEMARVEREGIEVQVPASDVKAGELVIVRPGDKIPVDGEVVAGHATVDQAAITGESMPAEAGPGAHVFAASIARLGHLRIRATAVADDTTFGRVIRMVQEAEQHRADVQRVADRFATWYLPVVIAVAAGTFYFSGNALATAAVLMVACSCSFALATPMAMIASIGAAARRGLLVKGSRYLESLAKADVVLLDKTGTLTLGRPQITDVVPLAPDLDASRLLRIAASAERYSEHPLAEAVRSAAAARGLSLDQPEDFRATPGFGVTARVGDQSVAVGSARLLQSPMPAEALHLEAQGKTLLFVLVQDRLVGMLAATDTLREDVPAAIAELRRMGISTIELLTGDNARTAAAVAKSLGIGCRANLLPEDKIAVVKAHQKAGKVVVMIGDGVNDAPALAQADVGIAMGAAGSAVALEAAHIALMREDWSLVPEMLHIARRTMSAVKLNIGFTVVYNLIGLTLASLGILPPAIAAAAQAGPDFGILANSARLLRPRRGAGRVLDSSVKLANVLASHAPAVAAAPIQFVGRRGLVPQETARQASPGARKELT